MNESRNEDLNDALAPHRERNKALWLMGIFFILMAGAAWYFLGDFKKVVSPTDTNGTILTVVNGPVSDKESNELIDSQYYTKKEIHLMNKEMVDKILGAIKENCCAKNSKEIEGDIILKKGDVVFDGRTGKAIVDNGVILYPKGKDVLYDNGVVIIRDGKKVNIDKAIIKEDGTIVPLKATERKEPTVKNPQSQKKQPKQKSYIKPSQKSQKPKSPKKDSKEVKDMKDKMAQMKKDYANQIAQKDKDYAIAMEYSLPGKINSNGNLEIDTSKIEVDFKDVITKKSK